MNLKSFFNKIYFSDNTLSDKDYENSRKLFLYESSAAVGIFSLTTGAFIAGFAKFLNSPDEFNGIIGAVPAIMCIFQIISSLIFEKIIHRKFLIAINCLIFRLLLGFIFFIPIFAKNNSIQLFLLLLIYCLSYSLSAFITPPASNWIIDLTPDSIRGRYFAKKDAYSLTFVTIITLIMGKVLDIFRNNKNEYGGFVVLGIVIISLTIINFIFLSSVKEPIDNRKTNNIKIKDVIFMSVSNKNFRKVITLSVLWNVALQIAGPFFAVYMVASLNLSYSYIMLVGLIGTSTRVISARFWGNLADKKSWLFTTKASLISLSICHFVWFFITKENHNILIPLCQFIGGFSWAGIAISMFNIQFDYAPLENRTAYLGTSASLGGAAGFLSTLVGAYIVKIFKNTSFKLGLISITNMQITFILSAILILFTVYYIHKNMNKAT